jgi:hypothetical protein
MSLELWSDFGDRLADSVEVVAGIPVERLVWWFESYRRAFLGGIGLPHRNGLGWVGFRNEPFVQYTRSCVFHSSYLHLLHFSSSPFDPRLL